MSSLQPLYRNFKHFVHLIPIRVLTDSVLYPKAYNGLQVNKRPSLLSVEERLLLLGELGDQAPATHGFDTK